MKKRKKQGDFMPNRDIKTIEQVMKHAKTYLLEEDILFIQEAYDYAAEANAKQFRKSGEPYIVHPIQVASILVDLELDPSTIAGGFLHDVVEDTDKIGIASCRSRVE